MKRQDTVDIKPRSKEPSNLQSLSALRLLERAPIHNWEADERELLTVLYRWYNNTDPGAGSGEAASFAAITVSADVQTNGNRVETVTTSNINDHFGSMARRYDNTDHGTIPKVFNAITGLDLRLSVVRYQFESHILLYGGRAFPEFARVMAVPFHDPEGRYNEIRLIIEETAAEFGIPLSRRKTEKRFQSGAAQHAKSPRTRRAYKSLVRRAALKEKEKARAARQMTRSVQRPLPQELPTAVPPIGRVALTVDSRQEDEEIWSDVEDYRNLAITPPGPRPTEPPSTRHIAFRVWDANSRTLFDEDAGFVSQAF